MPERVFWISTAALILLLGGLLVWQSCTHSPSYDEAIHIAAAGWLNQTGEDPLNPETPPLVKQMARLGWRDLNLAPMKSLAACSEKSRWALWGDSFLFHNKTPGEILLQRARLPFMALTLFSAVALALFVKKVWGSHAALASLTLFVFEPNLLANGYLVKEDMPLAVFFFFAVWALLQYQKTPVLLWAAVWGLAAGAASLSKVSGWILWPAGLFFLSRSSPKNALWGTLTAILVVFSGNGFRTESLLYPLTHQLHHHEGHAGYFLGLYSEQGWLLYHPVALFLKTTPFLWALLLWALFRQKKMGSPSDQRKSQLLLRDDRNAFLIFLSHAILFLGIISLSGMALGVRLVLPILPLLCFLCGRTFKEPLTNRARLIGLVLLLGHAANSLLSLPHAHAYFSPLSGGSSQGWRFLADSNLDWGQDLPALKHFMEKNDIASIRLSYFGLVDPIHYGIQYQYLPGFGRRQGDGKTIPADGRRQFLAISVTNRLGIYFNNKDLYEWLAKRKISSRVGGSLWVYEVTGDAEAHREMMRIYKRYGFGKEAKAEARQILRISPKDAEAQTVLAP